ncbi:MAG: S46 family peptidase [Planctomycetes bacterium]|nr:S46 family peptidase [Planctomycetota bacterium]
MNRWPALALLAVTISSSALAQENLELGKMWTFERPPLAYLKDEYGFAPTAEWFDRLRLASIRFGRGCSSSFVSPKGLIMTNHHCVRDGITKVQGGNDWVKDGYYAKSLEDEVRVPDLTVQQFVGREDVTARMNEGIAPADDDATIAKKRAANQAAILERAQRDNPGLQPQVVTLFQGALFELYLYKVYDDIRLVFAPHLQTSHFGGDPDNFCYPRYCLDFAFMRAYADGKPVDTAAHYFRWCTGGVKEGELVFVTGNPGTTKRLLTHAQMEYLRDLWHPMQQELVDNRLRIRKDLVAKDPSLERTLRAEILSIENSQKAYRGYWDGLLDQSLMTQKIAAEKAFRARIDADPALKAKFGDVWDKLAQVAERRRGLEARQRFHTFGGHPVLALAVDVIRAGRAETAEARDAAAKRARDNAAAIGTIAELTRTEFLDHVARAKRWLPANDKWLAAVLDGRTPEQTADAFAGTELLDRQKLDDVLARIGKVWDGPMAVELVIAESIRPLVDAAVKEAQELQRIEETQGARIGQALFAAYGTSVSPDATLTLRFSDGVVKGYAYNGTIAPPMTSFHGLYARHTEFGGKHPFDVAPVWLERKDKIDLTKPMDLVSTNDIIGGNSGSPLVNANLEVVGLVFDGNIEMLPNRYVYRAETPRSVSVHVDGIMEALKKAYDAERLVKELLGQSK